MVRLIKCLEARVGRWRKPRVWVRGTHKGTGVRYCAPQRDRLTWEQAAESNAVHSRTVQGICPPTEGGEVQEW